MARSCYNAAMDVLADVLRVSALGNAILNRSELLAPFGLEVGPDVRAAIHVVERGLCWLKMDKRKPIQLGAGDIVLIPRGTVHHLLDDPRTPAEPFATALRSQGRRRRPRISEEARTALICAEIKFEEAEPHPLMTILPSLIHVSAQRAESDHGLVTLSRILAREALNERMGSELVIPRLIDTLLVFIVRNWVEQQPAESAGWLGALRDEQIGRALALIHEAPERKWTVDELASKVAMSRATFARRFSALVGESPHAYVTRWRMNVAARLLRSTSDSAERISASVGYDSPTAFGAAFRRHLSVSPGQYRRQAARPSVLP
jgi:AraC-like DNA-binding protein/mannose-6-phosphate isomerase-like protein (cupin superfamily)